MKRRVVESSAVPPGQFGLFLYGQTQASIAVGDGTLCIAGPFFRLPAQQIDQFTTAFLPLDFNNLPPGGEISSGETWNFQFWFRDPSGGPAGNNLSSAVQVQFCN